jgi:hypothetical protein
MVSIRENWTEIEGRVVDWRTSPEHPSYLALEIAVTNSADVPGFANLLAGIKGEHVVVQVDVAACDQTRLARDAVVRCRVRRGRHPGVVFANPERFDIER